MVFDVLVSRRKRAGMKPNNQPAGEKGEEEGRAVALGSTPTKGSSTVKSIKIHRCRFFQWEPAAVVAMAASRSGQLLAVARQNGVVEVRLTRQKYRIVATIGVTQPDVIRTLVWSRDSSDAAARLFVGCIDGYISEVDYRRQEVKCRRESFGGAVWCVASAHFRDVLAVACEDGSVKLFSTADGDLDYSRPMQSGGTARAVSLAWESDDKGLFVGSADGMIRHFDTATGQARSPMPVEKRGSIDPPIVWCLKTLSDGTLVSGDSLGRIHIWDGHTGTQEQRFALHEASVHALAVSPAEDVIFASGADSKLVCLKRGLGGGGEGGGGPASATTQWMLRGSNRAHTHDVLGLAVVQHQSRDGSLGPALVSGAKDTKLCTYSVLDFDTSRPKYITPHPDHPVASLADLCPSQPVLVRHDRVLKLWSLKKDATHFLQEPVPDVIFPSVKDGYITAAAITRDGKHIAYATAKDLRIYSLERLTKPSTVTIPGISKRQGVTALAFTGDSARLVIGLGSGGVAVADLNKKKGKAAAVVVESEDEEEGEDVPASAVTRLSCSADGGLVAVARVDGRIDIRSLTPSNKLRKEWTVPELDSAPTAVAYHSTAPDLLVVACVSNRFYLFHQDGKLKDWSKELGHRIPESIRGRADCVIGITFNPAIPSEIILYGNGFIFMVDLDKPHCSLAKILPEHHAQAKKQREAVERARMRKKRGKEAKEAVEEKKGPGRKRGRPAPEVVEDEEDEGVVVALPSREAEWNFYLHLGYQGILGAASMGPNELLVVEEPWMKIVDRLPDVVYRHRYGT